MTDYLPENSVSADDADRVQAVSYSVGKTLRDARLHLGLTVDEVYNRIKFAPRQIEALEADDFAHLPESAFLRGFVRSYARLLQIDAIPLLAALPKAEIEKVSEESTTQIEVPFPNIYSERKNNILWLAAALGLAALLALSAWFLEGHSNSLKVTPVVASLSQGAASNTVETKSQDAASATVETLAIPLSVPVSAIPDGGEQEAGDKSRESGSKNQESEARNQGVEVGNQESGSRNQEAGVRNQKAGVRNQEEGKAVRAEKSKERLTQSSEVELKLTFDGNSWVEISDKYGKLLLSQLNHAGTEQNIRGVPPFAMVIGHSKVVHLFYKGQPVDLAAHTQIEVARLTLE